MAILDQQSTTGNSHWALNNNNIYCQTFTAGYTGVLDTIELDLYFNSVGSDSWDFVIYPMSGSNPDQNNPLGTITVPYASLPKSRTWFSVDFSSLGISLSNGVQYAIGVRTTSGASPTTTGGWYYSSTNPYAGGNQKIYNVSGDLWWDYPSNDRNFKTYMNVPVTYNYDFPINAELAKQFPIRANLYRYQTEDFPINAHLFKLVQKSFPINFHIRHEDNKSRHKINFTFNQEGTATVTTNLDGGRTVARKSRISRIFLYLKDTGDVGSDTVIDINVDGTSVFSAVTKPTIPGNSSINLIGVIPDIRNINSNSVITADVDSVAANASDISVIVELNTATSYTHEVKRVELLDDELLVDRENGIGYTTSTLQLRIVFDEPMNTAIEPTITWQKDTMELNPTIPSGGTWSSTYEKFDTYTTPYIDVSNEDDYTGTADVKISEAQNVFGDEINEYDFVLELIQQSLVVFEDTHTNILNSNTLLLNAENVERFRYSLDQTNWSSWQDFIEEVDINLSDAGIGGPPITGTVTLYVELEDITGKIRTKTAEIYYSQTLNQIQNFDITGAGRPDWWMMRWNLPSGSDLIPIDKYEIYVDDVLYGEVNEIYPLSGIVEDSDNLTLSNISVDNSLRKITYTISTGKCYTLDGTEITFSSTTDLEKSHPDTDDRYDLICVDTSGNLIVISGDEGLINREVRPFEKEYTSGTGTYANLPKVQNLPIGHLPLYYIRVHYYDFVGAGGSTYKYAKVNIDDDTHKVSKSKTNFLINLPRTDADQIIKIKAIGRTGAYSEYTHTFEKSPLAPQEYTELEAYNQPDAGGSQLLNGVIITANDAPNNIIYLNFVERE